MAHAIATREELEQILHDVLKRLYDPLFQSPETLASFLGFTSNQETRSVQSAIIDMINSLRLTVDVLQGVRHRRIYDLLYYRYVQELTQEETAERLGISSRHMRREQQAAIHFLAQGLWERYSTDARSALQRESNAHQPDHLTTWHDQVRDDLSALQKGEPINISDVGATIRSVVTLESVLLAKRGIGLDAQIENTLAPAAIHPTILRQLLIAAIERLMQGQSQGHIAFSANQAVDRVVITVEMKPRGTISGSQVESICEVLSLLNGRATLECSDDGNSIIFDLPAMRKLTVLVVDDNPDIVSLYQRYVAGTPYQICHAIQLQDIDEAIKQIRPEVIVLDILLPHIDGLDLLIKLRQDPPSCDIPVVVCSVLGNEELAKSLGAAACISKPVRKQDFLRALELALITRQQRG